MWIDALAQSFCLSHRAVPGTRVTFGGRLRVQSGRRKLWTFGSLVDFLTVRIGWFWLDARTDYPSFVSLQNVAAKPIMVHRHRTIKPHSNRQMWPRRRQSEAIRLPYKWVIANSESWYDLQYSSAHYETRLTLD